MNPQRPAGGIAFHRELRAKSADIWEAILQLPFLDELRASRLPLERFAYFITQDLLYLDEFARVLAIGAARSSEPRAHEMFLRHARNVAVVEQALHATTAAQLGIDPDAIREYEAAPVTTASLAELVAAILPCYDVYHRVGEHLAPHPPRHPLYAAWVASYASPEFAIAVEEQLELVDRLAADEDEPTRARMVQHYRKSTRYEWMFWQQAYDLLAWPVGQASSDPLSPRASSA